MGWLRKEGGVGGWEKGNPGNAVFPSPEEEELGGERRAEQASSRKQFWLLCVRARTRVCVYVRSAMGQLLEIQGKAALL